jgi:uncharacterized membrane protein
VSNTGLTALFAALFVATHFLLSHPLRAPLVGRLGPKGFLGLYSAVAFATFVPAVYFRHASGRQVPLWAVPSWGWDVAAVLMLLAAILLVGSFVRNPAVETLSRPDAAIGPPAGIFRWTRHPMMWSFAIWAGVHLLVNPAPSAIALAVPVAILALFGASAQDAKKEQLLGERWAAYERVTSFVPFGRGFAYPGTTALVGGVLLWLGATWAHPIPVGLWRWLA